MPKVGQFDYGVSPKFTNLNYTSTVTELALSLLSFRGEEWRYSGTAIIIGPEIAITARHVFEDHWKRCMDETLEIAKPDEGKSEAGQFPLLAFHVIENGTKYVAWDVRRICICPTTDIAVLFLRPGMFSPSNYTWKCPRLNPLPPNVGDMISAFGYRNPSVSVSDDADKITVTLDEQPTNSIGRVLAVHELKRDSGLLPFPCFHTNARFDGGMSGGPVFDSLGALVGLVCSGMKIDNPDEEQSHSSYGTLLWPLFGTYVDFGPDDNTRKVTILDLINEGVLSGVHLDRIVVKDGFTRLKM